MFEKRDCQQGLRALLTRIFFLVFVFCTALALPVYAQEHGGGGHDKPKSGGGFAFGNNNQAIYVNAGPLILPIILDDGAQSILSVLISLQVKDYDASDKVRAVLPKLMDGYMRALYGKFTADNLSQGKLVNVDFIKQKIARVTTVIMGEGVVDDVLIQAVAQRPLTPG